MKKKRLERSLWQILSLSGLLLFILPLTLMWVLLTWRTAQTVQEHILHEQQTITQISGNMLNSQLVEMEQQLQRLRMDTHIQEILREADFQEYNSALMDNYRYMQNVSDLLMGANPTAFDNVLLVNKRGQLFCRNFLSRDKREEVCTDWVAQMEDAGGEIVVLDTQMVNRYGEPLITIGQRVVDTSRFQFIGMVFLSYKQSILKPVLEECTAAGGTILTAGGRAITLGAPEEILEYISRHPAPEGNQPVKIGGQKYALNVFVCEPMAVKLFRYSTVSGVTAQLRLEQLAIILITVMAIFLFGMYLLYTNRKIFRPLQKITKDPSWGSDCYELNRISDTITSLKRKNEDGQEEIVRLIDHCKTTTLDKLQAQINPHFLYNTLSSIKYIAILNRQEKISQLISALVKLLRSAISREGTFIPLEDEMDSVRYYMDIENAVYEGNIGFTIHLPDSDRRWMVPNFILQPLVENCIYHGIHPHQPGGQITITANTEGGTLQLEVADNGEGFQDESLINMMEAADDKKSFTNLGIKAVQQKLQLLCGPEYGLKIFSKKGVGIRIVITLPLLSEDAPAKEESHDQGPADR